jgi:transcriptional regulator with XRE-family HTH domain
MVGQQGIQALELGAMSPIVLRVREARLRRGWTQVELARRAGVRRATVSELESRQPQRVDLAVLERIARALRVPTLALLRETRRKGGTP